MKIKVVSGFVGECPYLDLFLDSVKPYCERHGYEFVFDQTTEHKKGIMWRKLSILEKELNDCDWLLWIDTDCLILNQAKTIESLTGQYDMMMVMEEKVETGVILIRNSDGAKQIIETWNSYLYMKDSQVAMEQLLYQHDYNIQLAEDYQFVVKNSNSQNRKPQTLAMHFPGSTMKDKIEQMPLYAEIFKISDCYASYINMAHRADRNLRMIAELEKAGIRAERTRGLKPSEVEQPDHKTHVMQVRTPGAIGCHYSQVSVMEKALERGQHAFVMEDDLVFCDDWKERVPMIEDFLNEREWDVMWLGGTYHIRPEWHRIENGKHTNPDLQMCECQLNKDFEPTDNPRFVRTYGCWSTYAYIVNKKSLTKILELLDSNVYRSMGIDWLFILLQPQLQTFAFVPGCVKQYDNPSDIGLNGNKPAITVFSGFARLGRHWFQERMIDY